jgi:type IV secretory pathway protease TraF
MKWLRLTVLLLFAVSTCAAVYADELGIVRVDSPSVPMGYYRPYSLRDRAVVRGEYVRLRRTSRGTPQALRDVLQNEEADAIVKRVGGVAGDVVSYVHDQVHINGQPLLNSRWIPQDRTGRSLPRAVFPHVLLPGEIWLTSEHPRGLDSRYFGPVRLEAIDSVVELLWEP